MSKETAYETTCYIDKYNNLSGKLHLNENCYIDFDVRDIFCDAVPQKISSTHMTLLEELIICSPRVVKYDMLFELYYGDRFLEVDNNQQVLRNFRTNIGKYVPIKVTPKIGYRVELEKKIKKIKVDRDEIADIGSLFEQNQVVEKECGKRTLSSADVSALEFSSKFLCKGAKAVKHLSCMEVLDELTKLSSVFDMVSHIEHIGAKGTLSKEKDVVMAAYHSIVEGCENPAIKEVLKIKGPLGSYKNRIMQYLYLAVEKNCMDVLPIYLNMTWYETLVNVNPVEAFKKDLQLVRDIIAKETERKILFMIDGLRDFSYTDETMYYDLKDVIKKTNCKLVVCVDSDFTVNKQQRFKVHPIASNNFESYIKITSMNLYRREESIEFIDKCKGTFDVKVPGDITSEMIYENLVRLNFISLDAYWLVYVLSVAIRDIVDERNNISDIYSSICNSLLGTKEHISEVSEIAYEFEFGSVQLNVGNADFNLWWELVSKHRSIQDFLIAKHYIKKVSELKLKGVDRSESIKNLAFFNMVLQKNVTRFVVSMLKGIDDYEHQIMIIANDYYDDLSLFGKSELTFWMARLQNPKRKKECVHLLKEYREKEIERYEENQFESIEEKRDAAFLLRGINVSLIYEKDKEAFEYYLNSLLTDKIANSVNRGFHLEYYGDKPYIPNKTLPDFEDDLTAGENTLTVLCLSVDRRIEKKEVSSYVAVLEVMTICNLIQARIEDGLGEKIFNVLPYAEKCMQYIKWILPQRTIRNMDLVKDYFEWIQSEFTSLYENAIKTEQSRLTSYASSTFNKYSDAQKVQRTGWVKRNIPQPENIVEHMYNCWLLGMLYLPEQMEHEEYNKNTVLNMLLIHDLGETETGDIDRPEKNHNSGYYRKEENRVMQSLLFTGTYPGRPNLKTYFQYWNEWHEKESINFLIAKDIDNIQTIYQFCKYYLDHSDILGEEEVKYWLKGIGEVETDVGRELAEKLILRNPQYAEIMKLHNE